MLVVGLTGGIASGKSTIEKAFVERGVPTVDADLVAREVVQPGEPGLAAVAAEFGPGVLAPDGQLDRRALRERIFTDPAERARLERILHPLIRARVHAHLAAVDAPYALLVAPLLLEAGLEDLVDHVLVVDVPETVQLARLMTRDHTSEAQARAALAAQLPRRERLARADEVIDNSVDPSLVGGIVDALHQRYLALAHRA